MASITRFYALILSTVLLISGVPGFFPNILAFQPLITFFALTLVHSMVHAAVGLLGLLLTALASDDSVRIYTIGIALLYGVLAGVGLAGISFSPVLYFNDADNWLHGSIFILSLGVFLAGIAEERLHRRKAHIIDSLPASDWSVSPVSGRYTGSPVSRPLTSPPARSSAANNSSNGVNNSDGSQMPWLAQAPREQQSQSPWPQSSWPQSSSQHNQQYQQNQRPQSQPQPDEWPPSQPRDPWTREQRRNPTQRPANPVAPSQPQENPWPHYLPPQSQPTAWPQSQPSHQGQQGQKGYWPAEQPPQGPPPQSPWPQDSQPSRNPWSQGNPQELPSQPSQPWPPASWTREQQPQDAQRSTEPRDQWPLDEWPSLRDSRPLQ